MWHDEEEKKAKKFRKVAKSAAYSVGGGIGLWLLSIFLPDQEGSEKIIPLLWDLGTALFVFGGVVLATIVLKRDWTFPMHMLLSWLILPSWIIMLIIDFTRG